MAEAKEGERERKRGSKRHRKAETEEEPSQIRYEVLEGSSNQLTDAFEKLRFMEGIG